MKPPADIAEKFIRALQSLGWEIRDGTIYSEKDYLHFPYPDGWLDDLDHLKEIMTRRGDRFKDLDYNQHLTSEERELLIRVHTQALQAIATAQL